MKLYLKYLGIFILTIGMFSCETDSGITDQRDEFVGQWDYNDEMLTSKKDYTLVEIFFDSNSEDGIYIRNFANLQEDLKCRVSGLNLQIAQSTLGGLPISGSGEANLKVDEIIFYFTLDGDNFRAVLTKK